MFKGLSSLGIAAVLVCCLCGSSVFAKAGTGSGESAKSAPAARAEAKPAVKLKSDMEKLVADARAGKVAPRAQLFPNTRRNNLSTGAKIGIAAAIGGTIFLLIVLHQLSKD